MILFGKNITSTNDALVKVPVEKIYHALKNPKPDTLSQINQLRIVRAIDAKRYNILKRLLPYIVCGIFAPSFRRSENFAYIEYFMLDIDKISEKQISLDDLRYKIEKDSRGVLSFVSPSEDGLKVMFRLSERCYDKGMYALFYKAFAYQFARQYQIEQVIDSQTCDVTRACFVSTDSHAYYNPNAELVNMNAYLPMDNPLALSDLRYQLTNMEKESEQKDNLLKTSTQEEKADVDDEVMARIKAILKPESERKAKAPVYVPEQLNEIIDELTQYITQTGIEITEIINISYGKKIRMKLKLKQAEVNLFYGKRGFSVVKSPRSGTDEELNEVTAGLIETFLLM